jgi:PAS domain S-box-containing protein
MAPHPLQAVVELAPDPMLVLDAGRRIVALNERAATLFGWTQTELRGEPLETVLTLPDHTGAPTECTARTSQGDELPVEATLGDATDGHTAVALRDLRRRKRDEAALREAGQRFQRVFADGPVAMALVGDDYRFAEVNEAFCRLTGYDAAELANLSFTDITHPADRDMDLRLAGDVFGGEIEGYTLDKRYIRNDGDVIWISLTGAPLGCHGDRAEQLAPRHLLRHVAGGTESHRLAGAARSTASTRRRSWRCAASLAAAPRATPPTRP